MNELRAEKQEKNQKKVKEENTTTTRACARLYGIDIDVARRLLMNTNLLIMDVVAASMRIKGMTKGEVKAWIEYMDEVDYCFTTGRQINRRNFRRSMRMFHEMNKAKALAVSHFHKAKHWTPIGCDYEEMERIKRNVEAKKLKDDGTPEDEVKKLEADIQKATDEAIARVDKMMDAKEKEIMTV